MGIKYIVFKGILKYLMFLNTSDIFNSLATVRHMAPNCNSPNDCCAIWHISHPHGYILLLLALYLLLHLKTTDMDLSMTTTTIYGNQRSVVDCM